MTGGVLRSLGDRTTGGAIGSRAGIALKPGTPVDGYLELLPEFDQVLVMTVEPGFGGQPFMPAALGRIAAVRALLGQRNALIEVDGGITPQNAASVARAGASVLVAGSAVFRGDYAADIAALRQAAVGDA